MENIGEVVFIELSVSDDDPTGIIEFWEGVRNLRHVKSSLVAIKVVATTSGNTLVIGFGSGSLEHKKIIVQSLIRAGLQDENNLYGTNPGGAEVYSFFEEPKIAEESLGLKAGLSKEVTEIALAELKRRILIYQQANNPRE